MLLRRKKIIIITFILMQINVLNAQVVTPKNSSCSGIIFQNKLKYNTNMLLYKPTCVWYSITNNKIT
jgi:hypothetical protein